MTKHVGEFHHHDIHGFKLYLPDFVYGGIDGAITTFAVVAGVAGAQLSAVIVLMLGFANLLADGFSMAVSNYLSVKSEREYYQKLVETEKHEINTIPEQEKEEIRVIYKEKGFSGKLLEQVVEVITKDEKVWLETMMVDELGMLKDKRIPWKSALTTFAAFLLIGLIALLPFIGLFFFDLVQSNTFFVSALLTFLALFIVGSVKAKIVEKNWVYSGIQTMLVGGVAALIAYGIGYGVSILVG